MKRDLSVCRTAVHGMMMLTVLGSSSGFSIFSQKGVQWVNEKTGDETFLRMIQRASSSAKPGSQDENNQWKNMLFGKLFGKQTRDPPPPKEVATRLVNGGFSLQDLTIYTDHSAQPSSETSMSYFLSFTKGRLRSYLRGSTPITLQQILAGMLHLISSWQLPVDCACRILPALIPTI